MAHDIGCPAGLCRSQARCLRDDSLDLAFRCVDQSTIDGIGDGLHDDDVTQSLQQVGDEPARFVSGFDDSLDDLEECGAVVVRDRVDARVEERRVGQAQLISDLGIGDALGAGSGDHLTQDRQGVPHAARTGARNQAQGRRVGRDPLRRADRREMLLQIPVAYESEGVVVRSRSDCRQHFVRIRCREDEPHVRRRLLDELEKRVEASSRDHVGFVDDVDLVARGSRCEHRPLA